jgi:hypothetical protein
MLKLVVPIFVQDQFIGSAGGCGLLLDQGGVDSFLVNKITEIDEERVESLAQGIPALTREQAQELAQFIQRRIDAIVQDCTTGKKEAYA